MRHKGLSGSDGRDGHRGKHDHDGGGNKAGSWTGRKRPRAQRGDVRTAILLLVAEQPQHGYQIMQAMSARSSGGWNPSPGAVYPMITQLESDGLVRVDDEGGRRMVSITAAGRAELDVLTQRRADPFAEFLASDAESALAAPLRSLQAAVEQVDSSGTPDQVAAAGQVLAQARRSLYLILAGDGP